MKSKAVLFVKTFSKHSKPIPKKQSLLKEYLLAYSLDFAPRRIKVNLHGTDGARIEHAAKHFPVDQSGGGLAVRFNLCG